MKKEQSKLFLFKKEVDDFINSPEFLSIVSSSTYSMIIPQYLKAFQTFTSSGKRIRPYFVKLGYEMCNGVYDYKILLPAVSYEIFQSGILIHDDIIDNSDLRRGMPTMHKIIGEPKAICMGDFGLLSSIALCAHSEFSERLIQKAICHQINVYEMTIAGQLKDIELCENNSSNEEEILEMYHLKTAWYTTIGPMQLGAILAEADEITLSRIQELCYNIGIAFQIKDDIQGIFATTATTQKSDLTDMREGKHTILYSHFMNNSSEKNKVVFSAIYGNSDSGIEEISILRRLLLETGTYEYALQKCSYYKNEALRIVNALNVPNKYRLEINELIEFICTL